jgi:hypothetical protein
VLDGGDIGQRLLLGPDVVSDRVRRTKALIPGWVAYFIELTFPSGGPIWQKRNQNFWTGYSKYSRNITHWALASRTTPVTAAYAEQFIQQVVRLKDKGRHS